MFGPRSELIEVVPRDRIDFVGMIGASGFTRFQKGIFISAEPNAFFYLSPEPGMSLVSSGHGSMWGESILWAAKTIYHPYCFACGYSSSSCFWLPLPGMSVWLSKHVNKCHIALASRA